MACDPNVLSILFTLVTSFFIFMSGTTVGVTFSDKVSLAEDYSLGLETRFTSRGALAPMKRPLIDRGDIAGSLVSQRTAAEFKLEENGADASEAVRCLSLEPGDLAEKNILKELGTGIYLGNLHYLNWSELENGRVTGLSRFACYWVEGGEIVEPIQTMRFDETLENIFGNHLLDLSQAPQIIPSTNTYEQRALGGTKCPGVLLDSFRLTL